MLYTGEKLGQIYRLRYERGGFRLLFTKFMHTFMDEREGVVFVGFYRTRYLSDLNTLWIIIAQKLVMI